jgi:hypothetical protein
LITDECIGQEVCIQNHLGAKFKGTLKALSPNGNAILLCRETDLGYGWQRHSEEFKVVRVTSISLSPIVAPEAAGAVETP